MVGRPGELPLLCGWPPLFYSVLFLFGRLKISVCCVSDGLNVVFLMVCIVFKRLVFQQHRAPGEAAADAFEQQVLATADLAAAYAAV